MEKKIDKTSVPISNVIYLKKEIIDPEHHVPCNAYQAFLMDITAKDLILKNPTSFKIKAMGDESDDVITIRRKNILIKNNCYNICDANVDYPDTPYINIKVGEYSGDVRPFSSSHEGMHHYIREEFPPTKNEMLSPEDILAEIKSLNEYSLKQALQSSQVLF